MLPISSRVRNAEMQRQLLANDTRKFFLRLGRRFSTQGLAFAEMLMGGAVAFWLIAEVLLHVLGVDPLYTYLSLGILYSAQTTYYKRRVSTDPDYRIPNCKCGTRAQDGTEDVLRSKESSILGIPNSVLSLILLCAVLILAYVDRRDVALPVVVFMVAASAYLSYVMLAKLRSLCSLCMNITALNMLILLQLSR